MTVSDFFTPHYFDSHASKAQYSFTNAIKKPLQVLKNGYLSWHNPKTGKWWRQSNFGGKIKYNDMGVLTGQATSFRSQINAMTNAYDQHLRLTGKVLQASEALRKDIDKTTKSKAEAWRNRINEIAGKT